MFTKYLETPIGTMIIEATGDCLSYLGFANQTPRLQNSNPITDECARQLKEYFSGKRKSFDLPIKPEGTEFQQTVWRELLNIGYGETCSYTDIAIALGRPGAQRAVGTANGQNPLPIVIPCHRVIAKNNHLGGYGLGIEKKVWLLNLEGVRL